MEKQVYSISELVEIGYSKNDLYKAAKADDSDRFIVRRGGKFLFDLKAFRKWMREQNGR